MSDSNIHIVPDDDVISEIVDGSRSHDFVLLRFSRRRTSGKGFAVGRIIAQVTQQMS